MSLTIKEKEIKVTSEPGIDLEVALKSDLILNWAKEIGKTELVVHGVHIQSVDMFGKRVGFMKFKADIKNKEGKFVPGIVFARGGAVSILVILKSGNERYSLFTVQPRVPIGSDGFMEIPAGMLDGSGKFSGVAAKEMEEETGIVIQEKNLIDLTEKAYGNKYKGMFPSVGGCDEFLRLFAYEVEMPKEKILELNNKCTGLIDEGETITLKIVPFDEMWKLTSDSKTLCSLFLYEKLKLEGKI
ncbi:nudix hydrolase 14 [Anaeramoeba ignava]|uniref:Nudix hydrolase 14 n=1 Tax=Anaeramoeba ignava TaxID=1746090 RepID=A0A9Q0RA77_ANAIG|nr:nudix hydrolase 14 [Anaeramoeba ignava]